MRPVWGATGDVRHDAALPHISIYAPRMGRYASTSVQGQAHIHFNLCAPYGALRWAAELAKTVNDISIYAPRMGRYSCH